MRAACDWLKQASRDVWHWFFPRQIQPPDCVMRLLALIYPTVDWSRVSFFDGWPHVLGFSPNAAITLPDTYTPHRIHVYFKPGRWNPCSCGGMGLIVHEGFHVLQIQDAVGGWGLGFARPFIVQYLACWAANGFKYDDHPMENAAYRVAGRSSSLYEKCCAAGRLPCDCATTPPSVDESGLAAFEANCQHVVQRSSGGNFWTDMAHCTPGLLALHRAAQRLLRVCRGSGTAADVAAPEVSHHPHAPATHRREVDTTVPPRGETGPQRRSAVQIPLRAIGCLLALLGAGLLYVVFALYYAVWMVLWSAIAIVLWVVKIVVEIIGAIVAGVMWVATGIVCALAWIWDRLKELWAAFKALLAKACTWATELEQTCARWEEDRKQVCAEQKEERTQRCAEQREERSQQCTQQREERSQQCTQTREERTRNCCTWWPCSWACDAWTWVTNVVCVAWTWVTNVVCVAWTWVTNVVCVAWTWITNVVCVAWTWIVTRTCKVFTWVVKGATCW